MACQQPWSMVQQLQPMTNQQQWLGSCWPQASVLQPMECQLHEVVQPSMIWQTVVQPAIRHQVQSAIRQEKAQ